MSQAVPGGAGAATGSAPPAAVPGAPPGAGPWRASAQRPSDAATLLPAGQVAAGAVSAADSFLVDRILPNPGPLELVRAGVCLVDVPEGDLFARVLEGGQSLGAALRALR